MRACLVVSVLAIGCGRISFDPLGVDAAQAVTDGPSLDGADPSLVLWFPLDTDTNDAISGAPSSCLNACPTATAGKAGGGLQFDGATQCLQIADTGATHLQAFTLALWMDRPQYGEFSPLAKPFDPMNTVFDSWQIEDHSNLMLGFTTHNAGRHDVAFATTPDTAGWHHVAMTFDGSTKRMYIDGAMVTSMPEPDPVQYDTSPIVLGCDVNMGGPFVYPFPGRLDEFRVYSRALSDSEIATLAL